ncbi:lysophospholipid acyltransferase family protein [Fodinibius sp. Rm-B-1B1-1]|uniref:lysophospholipid acyltransferase family protein n=1 Tax=Fodinibius alkaliphilus TaxID=3140241 RepID=UPI00315A7C13
MSSTVKSLLIWIGVVILIFIWLPLLAVSRFFDRDPARYRTGKLFRKLGKYISKINPNWQIKITGYENIDDRRPYVMVCNHLSQADIPLISNLPWEMKWVAKKELFETPVVGWMMTLAGDISVDRRASNRREQTFKQATHYLNNNCSVMFFPEGTRSRDGNLNRFKAGAFDLAIKEQKPILPMVIDGTQNTLPKRSWKFGVAKQIKLKILDPIPTEGLDRSDIRSLTKEVRQAILDQLSEWRNENPEQIDNLVKS